MAGKKLISVRFPLGGVLERPAFQNPMLGSFYTPNCLNVLPDDTILGRERGGSRPGLGKAFALLHGSGAPIRSISDVSYLDSNEVTTRLVSISNGTLYEEEPVGTMVAATMSGLTLNSAVHLQMADRAQILYIADRDTSGVLFKATDGVVASTTTFTSASSGSFSGTNNNDYALTITEGGTGGNEVQTITMSGTPTGGTFILSLAFDGDLYRTVPIPYNATSTIVANALNNELGASSVAGGGGPFPGTAITVTFSGTNVDNIDHELIEAETTGLSGGTLPRISVAETTKGGPAKLGTYKITTTGSTLTVTPSMGVSTATGVSFYVTRAPKKWNPVTNVMSQWTASTDKGFVPGGCESVCLWRDRMVLAGGPENSTLWYMSRQGDPLDWDYAVVGDSGAAIASSTAEAGALGEEIRCLIPHSDDCLIFGCHTSLWIMRGDPGYGGQLDRLSSDIGIVSPRAYCYTPEGYLYFMSQDGLYQMAPGCGATPQSVSREKLPEDLLNIPTTTFVSMAYNVRLRLIELWLTPATAATPTHYLIDVKTTANNDSGASASFWPMTVNSNYDGFCCYARRDSISAHSVVMIGCRDGYIRQFQTALTQDDSTNFNWHLDLGPFDLSGDGWSDGMLHEIVCTLASGSGAVKWQARTGNSAEEAYNATSFANGIFFQPGFNPTARPRLSGGAAVIRLSNYAPNTVFGFEAMTLLVERGGRRRL